MSQFESDFFPDWARVSAIEAAGWNETTRAWEDPQWTRLNEIEDYYFHCFLKMAGWTGTRGQPRKVNSGRQK